MDDDEVSAQLIPPTILLAAVTTGIKIILLVNCLDMAHQEILRLKESVAAKTLVPRTIHHFYKMFVYMDFVLVISLVVFHITDTAYVHFARTLGMRMVSQMFPHGCHGLEVNFEADLTGKTPLTLTIAGR